MKQMNPAYLTVSDLDGTLLRAGVGVPPQNIEAIRKFTAAGGYFGVATGRSLTSIGPFLSQIGVNAPVILCNGSLIYDLENERVIREKVLPYSVALDILADVYKAIPEAGAEVMCLEKIYVAKNNAYTHRHTSTDGLKYSVMDAACIPRRWEKILLCMPEDSMDRAEAYLNAQNYRGVYFVRTSKNYLEAMPEGVNKGEALLFLAKHLDIDAKYTAGIGDYYNDLDLLKMASFSGTMAEAPQDIKVLCDMVVTGCLEGGVAQFLDYIRKNSHNI